MTNAVLLGILTLAGHPWLYLPWAGAWLTTNTLVTRIRSIAEHALIPDAREPGGRTRTTLASWWERLLIAPNRVNHTWSTTCSSRCPTTIFPPCTTCWSPAA